MTGQQTETDELMACELRPQGLKGVNHSEELWEEGLGATGTANAKLCPEVSVCLVC